MTRCMVVGIIWSLQKIGLIVFFYEKKLAFPPNDPVYLHGVQYRE